jgi:sugar phosphate permease
MKKNLRWIVVIFLFFVCVASFMDRSNFSIAAPFIREEFGLNSTQIGVIMSGFTIGYTVACFPGGLLSKRFSSRAIMVVALIGWSVMTLLTGAGWSLASFLVIRILFGVFEAPSFPNTYKIFGSWSLPKDRGITASLGVLGIPIGILLGNVVSAAIAQSFGWKSVFVVFGIVGFLLTIILFVLVRDRPEQHPRMSQVELHLIKTKQAEAGIKADKSQLTTLDLLKSPLVWALGLSMFTISLGFWGNINWLPTYFIQARNDNIMNAGINSSIPYMAMAVGVLVFGKLADSGKGLKGRWLALCTIAMVPFIIIGVLSPTTELCLVFFSISNFFYGGATCMGPAYEITMWKPEDVSPVHGFALTISTCAGIVAPILVGVILDTWGSFNLVYYIFTASTAISAIPALYLFRQEILKKRQSAQRQKAAQS